MKATSKIAMRELIRDPGETYVAPVIASMYQRNVCELLAVLVASLAETLSRSCAC